MIFHITVTSHMTHLYHASHRTYVAYGPYYISIASHITHHCAVHNYQIIHHASHMYITVIIITRHITHLHHASHHAYNAHGYNAPLPHIHHIIHHASHIIAQHTTITSHITRDVPITLLLLSHIISHIYTAHHITHTALMAPTTYI